MIGKFILIQMPCMGLGRSIAQLSGQNKETIDINYKCSVMHMLEQKIVLICTWDAVVGTS